MSLILMIGQCPDYAASLNIEQLIQENNFLRIAQVMNMPRLDKYATANGRTTFHDIDSCIYNAYVETSHKSVINAACEVHKDSNDNNQTLSSDIVNAKVSGDGAWQKPGYSSLNGVATLIANSKCIDNEVMSKKCKLSHLGE